MYTQKRMFCSFKSPSHFLCRVGRTAGLNSFNTVCSKYTARTHNVYFCSMRGTHSSAKKVAAKITLTKTHVKAAWDLLVSCFLWKESSTIGLSLLTIRLCIVVVAGVPWKLRSTVPEHLKESSCHFEFQWLTMAKRDRWVTFTWRCSAQFSIFLTMGFCMSGRIRWLPRLPRGRVTNPCEDKLGRSQRWA